MHGITPRRHIRPRRLILTAAFGLAVPLTVTGVAVAPASATSTGSHASAGAHAATGASAPAGVVVNGAVKYQRIAGFGASEAFGEAEVVQDASPAVQQAALSLLYSRTSGAGLTLLRNEISADAGSTIEPAAPSSPTAAPSYISLASAADDQGLLWWAQRIKKEFGVTDVFADAWSAPAFMKTNDSADNGGTLCGVPGATCTSGDWVQAYTSYLAQYAKDYAAAGVPLSYVGPENEADIGPDYDSMLMTPAQTADVMQYLGPALWKDGLRTQAECCATEGWDYAQQYAAAIEADPQAAANTALFTSHGYTEAPDSPLAGWTKPAWETEWSTFESWDPAWDDGTDASGLSWAQNIYNGLANSNLSAFLYWWGTGTPTFNGDNESLIQLNTTTGTVTPSGRLWAFANYSRFVRPGAVRIGTSSANSNLETLAFRNANGSVAIVVLNTATTAQTTSFSVAHTGASAPVAVPYLTDAANDTAPQHPVDLHSDSFTTTVPPRSLVTYYIR
jgi:O-glycosyl hydrolase